MRLNIDGAGRAKIISGQVSDQRADQIEIGPEGLLEVREVHEEQIPDQRLLDGTVHDSTEEMIAEHISQSMGESDVDPQRLGVHRIVEVQTVPSSRNRCSRCLCLRKSLPTAVNSAIRSGGVAGCLRLMFLKSSAR